MLHSESIGGSVILFYKKVLMGLNCLIFVISGPDVLFLKFKYVKIHYVKIHLMKILFWNFKFQLQPIPILKVLLFCNTFFYEIPISASTGLYTANTIN